MAKLSSKLSSPGFSAALSVNNKLELTSSFDFATSTSNPNTPYSDVYEYHKPLTGPWLQSLRVTGELGEDKHVNPKYEWGLIPFGGIGEPMIALYYEDDGDDRQGMLDRGEITQAQLDAKPANTFDTDNRYGNRSKPIFISEPGGTFATVRDRAGSHYEGFMRDSHTSDASGGPSFRIASQSGGGKRGAYVELGDGKGVECDFRISRPEGNVIDIRTNNADKLKIHNNLGWRRGLALLDGMGLYFQDDGSEVIETFTATADGDQDYTIAQSLSGSYSIVEVQVDGDGVDPDAINVSGQVLTITPHEYTDPTNGANYGHDVLSGDTVRVRMSNQQGTVLRMRGQWDGSKTVVNLGGTMKVNDIVDQNGQSAFTSGGGGTFADDGNVTSLDGVTDAALFRANGASDLPSGASNYGAGLSIKSDGGNAGIQFYGDYGDGDLFFRTGLPGSSGWNSTWYQVASKAYVDQEIAGASGGGTSGYVELTQNTAQSFTANTYTVVEFQASSGTAGWDTTNDWFVVPSSLNGTYAQIMLSMKASGSAGSGQTMILELQKSTNNGTNFVNVCQSANVDFYGNQSLSGFVEVQTGDILRARARFSTSRSSAGNNSVKMAIRFAP